MAYVQASLDEPTFTVVMHRTEPTRLQAMALQLAEKVNSLVETNERLMEMKQGNFGNFLRGQGGTFVRLLLLFRKKVVGIFNFFSTDSVATSAVR